MTPKIGDKLVYPSQGPCRISAVVNKIVAGQPTDFYRLSLLDGSGDAVLIPIDNLTAPGLRELIGKSTVAELLSHLENAVTTPKNWKQRTLDNAKLLHSGTPFDLAEIVESLTELNEIKTLTPRDRQTLDKARKLLICEISEVTGETRDAAAGQVDAALKSKGMLRKQKTACA